MLIALALGAASAWFIGRTAGPGGVFTTALGSAALTWAITRHRAPGPRRMMWTAVYSILALTLLWTTISIVSYARDSDGEPVSQVIGEWGRNHRLGTVVDQMEAIAYSNSPAKSPAKQLTLDPTLTSATGDTAAPTTTNAAIPAPAPIVPVLSPALPGEGQWAPIAKAGGYDAVWATSMRPLAEFGGVVASMAVIDQTYLRVGLFNGSEVPGGSWTRGKRIPTELYPALVAAFNGGFRFDHIKGGYVTEGRTVRALRSADATIAIGKDGKVVFGALGRDIAKDGPWVSLRQNLILIVDNSESQVRAGVTLGVWWGADYGRQVYVPRSALCQLADGRLAYAYVSEVDAEQLAQSLIHMGCTKAMQLDINGDWPALFTFDHPLDGSVLPHLLDDRMHTPLHRYLNGSKKEFFALFDSTLVPNPSVLDA
ncbi:unannotated protein [freshwater metagenome]|uniref:Unannotated protein n=1 Tax=freshwater metagenome TaxID=449393 RepID=A0A6J6XW29_9ZZZZ